MQTASSEPGLQNLDCVWQSCLTKQECEMSLDGFVLCFPEALRLGASAVISKPYDAEAVSKAIAKIGGA